jgi:hypothetical protein
MLPSPNLSIDRYALDDCSPLMLISDGSIDLHLQAVSLEAEFESNRLPLPLFLLDHAALLSQD